MSQSNQNATFPTVSYMLGENPHAGSANVKIIAGPTENRQEFMVHEEILCRRSAFFRNALRGEWKESTEKTISFPEDEAEIIAIYVRHLYAPNTYGGMNDNMAVAKKTFIQYCKVYVFVERIQDELAVNWVYNSIYGLGFRTFQGNRPFVPPLEAIEIVYEWTPENHLARKLLVEIFTRRATREHVAFLRENDVDDFPPEFLRDLAVSGMINI